MFKKKYQELKFAKITLGKVKLDKPVVFGWVRNFKLRSDIAKTNKSNILNKILEKINNSVVCLRRDFYAKTFDSNGKYVYIKQVLNYLTQKEFELLSEREQSYFYLTKIVRKWGGPIKIFKFKYPWMFEFKIKRNYITHKKILDGELESEIDRINKVLWDRDRFAFKYLECSKYYIEKYSRSKYKREIKKILKEEELI